MAWRGSGRHLDAGKWAKGLRRRCANWEPLSSSMGDVSILPQRANAAAVPPSLPMLRSSAVGADSVSGHLFTRNNRTRGNSSSGSARSPRKVEVGSGVSHTWSVDRGGERERSLTAWTRFLLTPRDWQHLPVQY